MKFTGELGTRIVTIHSLYRGSYYAIPKVLHYGKYRELSSTAREMYAVLNDKAFYAATQALANPVVANKLWVDRYGQVVVRISQKNIAFILGGISLPTVRKCFEQLEALDLIRRLHNGNRRLVDDIYIFIPDDSQYDASKLNEEAQLMQEEMQFIENNPLSEDDES